MRRFVLLATLVVTGCAALDGESIEDRWGAAMRRYGLIGVYPISEDLQPGDVLLQVPTHAAGAVQPGFQRLGSMPVASLARALNTQEARRLVIGNRPAQTKPASAPTAVPPGVTFSAPAGSYVRVAVTPVRAALPATADNQRGPKPPETPPDQNSDAEAQLLYQGEGAPSRRTARLRAAALPGFAIGRVSRTDTGVAAFFQGIGAVLGLSTRTASAVSLTLTDLQVAGLDALAAGDVLNGERISWIRDNGVEPHRLLGLTGQANPPVAQAICLRDSRLPGEEPSRIHVVNRVFYAGKIKYGLLEQSEFAAQVAARVGRGVLPVAAAPVAGPAPVAGTDLGSQIVGASQRAAAAGAAAAAAVPGNEGGSLTVSVGTFGNLSLDQALPRPMAVGFNAVETFSVRGSLLFTLPSNLERGSGQQRRAEGERVRQLLASTCDGLFEGDWRRDMDDPDRTGVIPAVRVACLNTLELHRLTQDPRLNVAACEGSVGVRENFGAGSGRVSERPAPSPAIRARPVF